MRRDGWVVEGGGLENRYTLRVSGVQIPFSPPFLPKMANEDASLHFTEPLGSTSHLHAAKPHFTKTREDVKTLHFIPLVKPFRCRSTCEVFSLSRVRMVQFFYCASLILQSRLDFSFFQCYILPWNTSSLKRRKNYESQLQNKTFSTCNIAILRYKFVGKRHCTCRGGL